MSSNERAIVATGDVLFDAPLPVRAVGQDPSGSSSWWASLPDLTGWGLIVVGNSPDLGGPAQVNPFTANATYQVTLTEGSVTVTGAVYHKTFTAWGVRNERYANPSVAVSSFTSYSGQMTQEEIDGAVSAPSNLGTISFAADLPLKASTQYTLAFVPAV
jgi:hypothetical protein